MLFLAALVSFSMFAVPLLALRVAHGATVSNISTPLAAARLTGAAAIGLAPLVAVVTLAPWAIAISGVGAWLFAIFCALRAR